MQRDSENKINFKLNNNTGVGDVKFQLRGLIWNISTV